MHRIGYLAELWRYPVKSMGGERCPQLELTPFGIAGDRQLALESRDAPSGKPLLRAAERTAMLRLHASLDPAGQGLIRSHAGETLSTTDPALPAQLAQALTRTGQSISTLTLLRSPRPLTDVRPVALHSLQTIHQLATELDRTRLPGLEAGFDPRRLRSNLVLDLTADLNPLIAHEPTRTHRPDSSGTHPFPEDLLAGYTLQIGPTARLRITERIPRCRIISLDPETATPDPALLRHLAHAHDGRAGIYARPLTPGTLRTGDPVYLS